MLRALILILAFGTELLGQHVEYKTFQSKLLGRELRYGVYVPPSYNASPARKYPVLYFLHGLFEDETRWSSRGQTDQIMDRMIADGKIGEFIVAVPFGGTSFYTNLRDGSEKWEDVIVAEFVPMIERSEEHTSELQSRVDLVCRLLLEKKKKIRYVSRASDDQM